MEVHKLNKLEEVLHLGLHQRIIDYEVNRLTKPGENYGSLMLGLEVKVLNVLSKSEEILNLVAKLLPPNELLRKLFNIQVTFKNELAFYSIIVPTLDEFQKEQGIAEVLDCFPKFFGGRISLNPDSDIVTDDAVFILENLKIAGFTTVERTLGFDLESAELILKNLAYFHAISLALKLKKPDVFEKKIKPYLADFLLADDDGLDVIIEKIVRILKENVECVPYLEKARELLKQKSVKVAREPFATICHNDFWTNNVMVQFMNGKPVANKMVDFQVIEYKSPCRDLLFFLFSSVQQKVLEGNVHRFINLYYDRFIEKLKEMKCNTAMFSRDAFDIEVVLAAKESEYFHIVLMLDPIHADATGMKELSEFKFDPTEEREVSLVHKEKLHFVTLEFARNGWL